MNGAYELERSYRFEAAHYLPRVPESHPCRRLHGHSYRIDVAVTGSAGKQSGWVVDFADIDVVVEPVCARLDHRLLNDIIGLENPTSEVLAAWLWERLAPNLPGLSMIRVAENPDAVCTYRGANRPVG
ncbi:MAG TPA: 6-carboxytetrahydropterin synthase QueD [Solirubrobacterales bacterium]